MSDEHAKANRQREPKRAPKNLPPRETILQVVGDLFQSFALSCGAVFDALPFGSRELLARVSTTLRRSQPQAAEAIFCNGNLEMDLSTRVVRKNGQEVKLTPTEYALLRLLVVHAGKVLTHRQLLAEVWGPKAVEQTQYLRVHIAHLREKLEDNVAQPKFIITEPAVGYRAIGFNE